MSIAARVLARFRAKLAANEIGEQTFGRFNVKFLAQHAVFVPRIGELLLDADKRITAAGYRAKHDINVHITGRGVSHALAVYIAQQSPPIIQIAPKAYDRHDLIHTLIHEMGHYFHDKVVSGGFRNPDVGQKYRWAIRQEPVSEGSSLDAVIAQIKKLEAEYEALKKETYTVPKKGTVAEFDYNWFGRKFRAKARVLGKKGKADVEIEVLGPPELVDLVQRTYRRPVMPVSVSHLTTPDPAVLARLQEITSQISKLQTEQSALGRGEKKNNDYEAQQHDWVPTTYARKNVKEWFAEMFVTDVLGHLKPEPSAWLKAVVG